MIRQVIDTLTSKSVLILGRFSRERKVVLDRLRIKLRERNLSPILCDFDVRTDRAFSETVTLLARMVRFVIADLSDPRSLPQELQSFVPDVAVPVIPIIQKNQNPWSMFANLQKYSWMLEPYCYTNIDELLNDFDDCVVDPANKKRKELSESRLD